MLREKACRVWQHFTVQIGFDEVRAVRGDPRAEDEKYLPAQAFERQRSIARSATLNLDRCESQVMRLKQQIRVGTSHFLFERAYDFSASRAFLVLSCPSVYNPVWVYPTCFHD